MTGREYIINKLLENAMDDCPSTHGLRDTTTYCYESGDGCEKCWEQALENEINENK